MKKRSFIARSVAIVLGITLGFGTLPSNTFKSEPVKAAEVTDITGLTTVETVGDINGDGEINAKDVTMLRRYLAGGWGVTVNEEDADINVDGEVNAKDVTMLRRYLAGGWGVELIGKTSKTVPKPYQITEPIKVEKHWEIEFDNENFVFPKYDEITGLLTEVAHIDVIGVVDSVTYSYYETGIIKSISRIYNINRDTFLNGGNQTIETEYYDENGIKTGTEYRYIPGPESPNTEQKYGSTKKITYNDNIVSIIEENTDGDITRINEEYDKNGNIILETWNCSDGRTFTERYEYEYYDSGVIKKIKKIFPELNTFETYYDEYGRENGYGGVRTDGSVFEENYKYDIEGRIRGFWHDGGYFASPLMYIYN